MGILGGRKPEPFIEPADAVLTIDVLLGKLTLRPERLEFRGTHRAGGFADVLVSEVSAVSATRSRGRLYMLTVTTPGGPKRWECKREAAEAMCQAVSSLISPER